MQPIIVALLALLGMPPGTTVTMTVEAGRDATLIEDPDGGLANGAGPALFVGRRHRPGSASGARCCGSTWPPLCRERPSSRASRSDCR